MIVRIKKSRLKLSHMSDCISRLYIFGGTADFKKPIQGASECNQNRVPHIEFELSMTGLAEGTTREFLFCGWL